MNLLDLTPEEAEGTLYRWIAERDQPAYRVNQMIPRLWQRPVPSWSDTTDLPASLIGALEREFPLTRPSLETLQQSSDGTVKFLWRLDAATAVESVLIPEGRRSTLCISSQAGCAYGCVFCATGRMGFQRHLSPWEITAQVRELILDERFGPPTNVVFMGMGEPLHNWHSVDTALTILNDPRGMGIGARRITVSTVGIIPNLRRLAARPEQFRIAISLHSPNGKRRAGLMPVERKYPLADVLRVLELFPKRVTFEYVMIAGRNDSDEDAEELARLARTTGALVNLLPLHPGGVAGLEPTPPAQVRHFAQKLRSKGGNATVRRSRGLDISAACGQLRLDAGLGRDVQPKQDTGVE
jgi:23S rRNA (adenine2503-C2)-methyltransferase